MSEKPGFCLYNRIPERISSFMKTPKS